MENQSAAGRPTRPQYWRNTPKPWRFGAQDGEVIAEALGHLLESPVQIAHYQEFTTGETRLEEMNEPELIALQRLLKPSDENGHWKPCPNVIAEAAAVIAVLDEQEIQSDSKEDPEN